MLGFTFWLCGLVLGAAVGGCFGFRFGRYYESADFQDEYRDFY